MLQRYPLFRPRLELVLFFSLSLHNLKFSISPEMYENSFNHSLQTAVYFFALWTLYDLVFLHHKHDIVQGMSGWQYFSHFVKYLIFDQFLNI